MANIPANQPDFLIELPVDGFTVIGFEGTEQLSVLPRFDIRLSSDDPNVDFGQIINQSASITILTGDGTDAEENRVYGGVISHFSLARAEGERYEYRAVLVPRLYTSTLNRTYRIFQRMTGPAIVEEVLTEIIGLTSEDYEINLRGHSFPQRNYCTQYNESDFAFISRLLEEEGLFYFFRYDPDSARDILMIDFDSASLPEITPESTIQYNEATTSANDSAEFIHEIRIIQRLHPGQITVDDYNPEEPERPFSHSNAGDNFNEYEIFEYPGGYDSADSAAHYAQVNMEAIDATYERLIARGNNRHIRTGKKLSIEGYWRDDVNERQWTITKVEHHGVQPAPGGGTGTDVPTTYNCRFYGIPNDIPYRPLRLTPKPRTRGTHTAQVVGPDNEQIYIDDLGRVKIHFLWDRTGPTNQDASCWVRVAQDAAGPDYGFQAVPRIGHEVVVDFIDGNPDRPIIIGSVYNQTNTPCVGSGSRTQHSLRSAGGNAITFDDADGSQQFNINASYDQSTTIANNQTIDVGVNQSLFIGTDMSVSVGSNAKLDVGGNYTVAVNAKLENSCQDREITIGSTDALSVGSTRNVDIGGDAVENYGSNHKVTVGGSQYEAIASNLKIDAGSNSDENVGGNKTINVGSNLTINAGGSITLAVGGSTVKIDASGVTIQGTMVSTQGSAKNEVKGAAIGIEGGMVEIKGSLITNN